MLPTRPLALVALLAIVPLAQAGSDAMLSDYALLPTEHDDQGRSDEPDHVSTSVLGPDLTNCVLSLDAFATPGFGRACLPDGGLAPGVLAPGCTDDAGRQPSGLCGLWSQGVRAADVQGAPVYAVPPGTVGTRGMSGTAAPGAFTPTKDATVRLLDIHADVFPVDGLYTGGARTFDLDHKVADAPVDLGLGPMLLGPTALWAWYGLWRDANGNGVIDDLGDEQGHALAGNEFVWVGACGAQVEAAVCRAEAGLRFPFWVWPGDHHMSCGFDIGCTPADYPGAQVLCFAVAPTPLAGTPFFECGASPDDGTAGDPLLGEPDHLQADGSFFDATGSANVEDRVWRGASPSGVSSPPMLFYDQSLLGTTIVIGGPTLGSPEGSGATGFDLGLLQFVDVDRFTAASPAAEQLLAAQLKPQARDAWLVVRDEQQPTVAFADSVLNSAALDPSPTLGPLQQQLLDPGWAREPNTAQDAEPGAAWHAFPPSAELPASEQDFRGWENDMSAYAQGWHAFADVQAHRVEFTYGAVHTPLGQVGASGGVVADSLDALTPRGPGEHARSLEPGAYQLRGFVGAWHDLPQSMDERVLDPVATALAGHAVVHSDAYALPPDGWVGNVVNTTGGLRSRGYEPRNCTIAGVRAERAYSVCDPYLDDDTVRADADRGADQGLGLALPDPQDAASPELLAPSPPAAPYAFVLAPDGGTWDVPVLVWRDFFDQSVGQPVLEVDTGLAGPITLQAAAGEAAHPAARDLLLLPEGNCGLGITSTFDADVVAIAPALGASVREHVRDVDAYAPLALPAC